MTVKIIKHGTEGFPRETVRTTFWNNLNLRQRYETENLILEELKERKILVVKTFKEKYFGICFMLLIFELIFSRCPSFCFLMSLDFFFPKTSRVCYEVQRGTVWILVSHSVDELGCLCLWVGSLAIWGREEIVDYFLFKSRSTLPYSAGPPSNELEVRWYKSYAQFWVIYGQIR